jgi:hypothetical protein
MQSAMFAAAAEEEHLKAAVAFYESPQLSVAAAHGDDDDDDDDDNHQISEAEMQRQAKLCVMASKLAYETEDVIRAVVTRIWKVVNSVTIMPIINKNPQSFAR